jgi:hypothetical protein
MAGTVVGGVLPRLSSEVPLESDAERSVRRKSGVIDCTGDGAAAAAVGVGGASVVHAAAARRAAGMLWGGRGVLCAASMEDLGDAFGGAVPAGARGSASHVCV